MSDAIEIAAVRLVEPFEGFRAAPYQDVGGYWTIGFGSTRDAAGDAVTADTPTLSRDQALALVERDLTAAARQVQDSVVVALNVNQQAALIDFVYNLGAGNFCGSTLLRLLNVGNYSAAAGQFTLWDHAAGQVLPGLLRRREAEAALFRMPPDGG